MTKISISFECDEQDARKIIEDIYEWYEEKRYFFGRIRN